MASVPAGSLRRRLAASAAVVVLLVLGPATAARPMIIISSNVNGVQGDAASDAPAIGLGVVAFDSDASNLSALVTTSSAAEGTPGLSDVPSALLPDANGARDVFLHEVETGRNIRVSVPSIDQVLSLGFEADGDSRNPDVSSDGNLIVFESDATNLVQGDTNGSTDVFLHNRLTGRTDRLSISMLGAQGNGSSRNPSMSPGGEYVAFESDATNLGATPDTNALTDVYVRDRTARTTTRVSAPPGGGAANGPSFEPSLAGSAIVAFGSDAANLVTGDANGTTDVFVHGLVPGTNTLVSISSLGAPGDGPSRAPSIAADGRQVAFESDATTLDPPDSNGVTDVFRRDLISGITERVSSGSGAGGHGFGPGLREADGPSFDADIAPDGGSIAFVSLAGNLVTPDLNALPDVFLAHLTSGAIELISSPEEQMPADGPSRAPAVANGIVAFASDAHNLIRKDANGVRDVFATCTPETGPLSTTVHDLEPGAGPAQGHLHRVSCAILAPLGA